MIDAMTQALAQSKQAELSAKDLRRLENDSTLEYVDDHFERKNVSRKSSRDAMTIGVLFHTAAAAAGDEVEVYGADLCYRCHPQRPNWFRKPDASLIRLDRLADFDELGMMPIPADLAVEVNSPEDRQKDIDRKVGEYLAAGFPLVWVVDPPTRTVRIHRGDGTTVLLNEDDDITGEAALPAFRCKVAEFFA